MTTDTLRFELARERFMAGIAAHEAGDLAAAEAHFRASLDALPGRPSTLANLGVVLLKLGQPAQAADVLAQSLAAQPGQPDALFHWGSALFELGDAALGLEKIDAALALEDRSANAWLFRGQCLLELGRPGEALASFDQALARDPAQGFAHRLRGDVLRDQSELEAAAAAYRRALDLGFEVESTAFLLAVAQGRTNVQAPQTYVEQLFDGYAASFDAHLVGRLGYDAPAKLAQLVAQVMPNRRFVSALDIGCGTGLAIGPLSALADAVDGVDLSERMLEHARAQGGYRQLVRASALAFLRDTPPATYELALAADLLIYIGELEPLFAAVRASLREGGVFALTAECAPEGTPRMILHAQARYAHAAAYVQAAAASAGFECRALERKPLRAEQTGPVDGHHVVLVAT